MDYEVEPPPAGRDDRVPEARERAPDAVVPDGFAAAELRDRDVVLAGVAPADRVDRDVVPGDFAAVDFARDADGFDPPRAVAAVVPAAVLAAVLALSSAATRRERLSISRRRPRTSSRTRRSSIVSRMRAAACATSSTSARVRFWVPIAPSVVAWNVRSTALRTASTASAASEPLLSFFFLSFFAMARV